MSAVLRLRHFRLQYVQKAKEDHLATSHLGQGLSQFSELSATPVMTWLALTAELLLVGFYTLPP